jgi:hypothetical protein
MSATAPEPGPQPAPEHIISALTGELRQVNDNRWYLLSLLAQKDAELAQRAAQLSQMAQELERLRAGE